MSSPLNADEKLSEHLLVEIWRRYERAVYDLRDEVAKRDCTLVGHLIVNRAHARTMFLDSLLEDFCDLWVELGMPIPSEVKVCRPDSVAEGQ